MNVLDLFSGIGGFSLGLERAGMRTVAFCEIDKFCRKILRKHWPNVAVYKDIETMHFFKGQAEIIAAGFPCQDISFAGEGAGITGERSGLYREVIRAIRMVRPAFAVLENVAALLGRGLDTILGDLAEIGYDAEWHCIPASSVGAPHRRDRIWIIADPGGDEHKSHRAPLSGSIAAQLSSTSADAQGMFGPEVEWSEQDGDIAGLGKMADAASAVIDGERPVESWQSRGPSNEGWWAAEPDVGRVAHGVPLRVDRLRSLGNSVVPQIPEIIGRAILASER